VGLSVPADEINDVEDVPHICVRLQKKKRNPTSKTHQRTWWCGLGRISKSGVQVCRKSGTHKLKKKANNAGRVEHDACWDAKFGRKMVEQHMEEQETTITRLCGCADEINDVEDVPHICSLTNHEQAQPPVRRAKLELTPCLACVSLRKTQPTATAT